MALRDVKLFSMRVDPIENDFMSAINDVTNKDRTTIMRNALFMYAHEVLGEKKVQKLLIADIKKKRV